ncbi:MAG TPA: hypothetical protein VK879_14035 [Candidatus Sulfomarinibacteraceae bacterium]|nr:hypothetical protein [Candidatus Sulfomarinibacteraceae bacterium]
MPTPTAGSPGADAETFGPTAVQPNRVSNASDTQLVVTGAGFLEGAAIILDGFGALDTTFVSASMLRALLPANVAPGVYHVRVVNPDAGAAVLENALTITAPAPTAGPTEPPEATATPQPTAFLRPVIVVQSYGASSAEITPGSDLAFEITLANAGQSTASNIIATFVSGDFVPRATGGVHAVGVLTPGQPSRFWQPLSASPDLGGKSTAVLEVQVAYTDVAGTAYNETFSLTFPVVRVVSGPGATATATPTATAAPRLRPQLLVSSYATDKDPLEPGARFALSLDVRNAGNTGAERVTLIVGGGSDGSGPEEGTAVPGNSGGVSGAGGEFGNFAPVGSSNISFLGDLRSGETLQVQVQLIVNASTKPGAYPVVVSFVYNDETGARYVDEQVVTLLVYARPLVEIDFYTEPAPLFAGQPGPLPVQMVNVGKNSTIFGNMNISGSNAQFTNNNIFVGALEPGGFFPLDATVIPEQPGVLELIVHVSYTDDFNQSQVVSETLTIEVLEAPPMEEPPVEPGMGEPGSPGQAGVDPGSESWRQKAWRFVLGMIGLSSGRAEPGGVPAPGPIEGPVDGPSGVPGPGMPIPVDPGYGARDGVLPTIEAF